MSEEMQVRLEKLNKVLEDQKAFLHRIPDPDTRERAEGHLHVLVEMRDQAANDCATGRVDFE